ncbi:MAG: glycosyltransferase family 4 protein [Deltaproteobacteria bacterium]|nr:glycosyltransferase family 4 protein [Deltaproteobacteria bacterium]
MAEKRLNICLLSYRGNPNSGGQGVYIHYLSRALMQLGHKVTVISSPPYPEIHSGVELIKIPNLDLYNPSHLFKPDDYAKLRDPINFWEYFLMTTGGFPEPLTFGLRVSRVFREQRPRFDIVHDNQCLAYGILDIARMGYPTVATIHHPITVDYQTELSAATTLLKRLKVMRWYSFLRMQKRVVPKLSKIITVSECSRRDISRDFKVPVAMFRVVPNGINTDFFFPQGDELREDNRLLVTTSSDTPLKGLSVLLRALHLLNSSGRQVKLTVIGEPKKDGLVLKMVEELQLGTSVWFTGRIDGQEFANHYARTAIAVVPSLYEGFGMPAGEAMACGVPVISSDGGALPEVVGDAGIMVPAGSAADLAKAIARLLDSPAERKAFAQKGLLRVAASLTWEKAAQKTVDVYREVIGANHRF